MVRTPFERAREDGWMRPIRYASSVVSEPEPPAEEERDGREGPRERQEFGPFTLEVFGKGRGGVGGYLVGG